MKEALAIKTNKITQKYRYLAKYEQSVLTNYYLSLILSKKKILNTTNTKKSLLCQPFTYISSRFTMVPHSPHRLLAISSTHRASHYSLKDKVEHTFQTLGFN